MVQVEFIMQIKKLVKFGELLMVAIVIVIYSIDPPIVEKSKVFTYEMIALNTLLLIAIISIVFYKNKLLKSLLLIFFSLLMLVFYITTKYDIFILF